MAKQERKTVLIASCSTERRIVMRDAALNAGYEPIEADSPDTFSDAIALEPEAVLLDESLLALEHVGEVCAEIAHPNTQIIYIGESDSEVNPDAFGIQVALYFTPEVDCRSLTAALRTLSGFVDVRHESGENLLMFKKACDNALDAIIIMGPDGEITFWNKAAEKIFGWKAEEVMGMNLHHCIAPPALLAGYAGNIEKYRKTGKGNIIGKIVSLTARRRDGSEFSAELALSSLEFDGKWNAIGILRDISSHKEVEERLLKSEQTYKSVVDNINSGVSLLSRNMEIMKLNRQMREWFPDVNIGDHPHCYKSFHGLDAQCAVCPARETFHDGQLHEAIKIVEKPEGDRYFRVATSPITDKDGNITGVVETVNDITNKLKAEKMQKLLASIVENSSDAIIGTSLDGDIFSWNAAAKTLFGYEEAEVINTNIRMMIKENAEEELDSVRKRFEQGETIIGYDTAWKRKDGSRIDVSLTVSPVADYTGSVVGVSTIARDATERKRVEKMKDEFISIVSHELRTPLTSLRGSLGLLCGGVMGDFPDEAKALLDIAHNNTDRLVRLISDMLDLQKIESGRIKMNLEKIDLDKTIKRSIDEMSGFATQNGVSLTPVESSLDAVGDSDRLLQVIDNLISNAVKHSPEGAEVVVAAEKTGKSIIVSVKDNGNGIPDEFRSRIFQKFQQASDPITRSKGGTGLGLAICRAIVEGHGGEIWYESQVGVGSTFYFTLSLAENESCTSGNATSEPVSGAKSRIVIINENSNCVSRIAEVLEQYGYSVEIYTEPKEPADASDQDKPLAALINTSGSGLYETLMKYKEIKEFADAPVVTINISNGDSSSCELVFPPVIGWRAEPEEISVVIDGILSRKSNKTPEVLIIDDDQQLQKFLSVAIKRKGINVRSAGSGRMAVEALQNGAIPDLIILDIMMPDGDGFYVADFLRGVPELFHIPLVVYSARDDFSEEERAKLTLEKTFFVTKLAVNEEAFTKMITDILKGLEPFNKLKGDKQCA